MIMYNVMRALRTIKTPGFGVCTAIVAVCAMIALPLVIAGCDTDTSGGGGTSKVAAGGACNADGECADDLICAGMAGSQECSRAGDRMPGSVCGSDSHCANGLVCAVGVCSDGSGGSVCGSDFHCTGRRICGNGACGNARGVACAFDSECAGDLFCGLSQCSDGRVGSACIDDSHCTAGSICFSTNNAAFICTVSDGSAGSVCRGAPHCDFNCSTSNVCTDGTAGSRCARDSHCATGFTCNTTSFMCETAPI